ncbi:MAG: hypothetical protein VX320_06355 [Candidatus Thermoplasmatota archaeon]|nr:hypothetical protein [Candidatus Thermoplasmatota archaeon]
MSLLMMLTPMTGVIDAVPEKENLEEKKEQMNTSGRSMFTCADYNGQGGPVWQGNSVLQGEIYEYPAGSGAYWIAEVDSTWAAGNELAPGSDPDVWMLSCDCDEIWDAAGQPYWDSQTTYGQYDIIRHVTGPNIGDNNTWISLGNSNLNNEPGQSASWRLCSQDCSDFGGFAGTVWASGMTINDGDIVEWPAMSGQFWIADNSASPSTQPPGLYQGSIWKMTCTCAEIAADVGGAIWDSSDTYGMWEIVSHNGVYWISQMHTPSANTNHEPGVSGWVWEMCGATCGAYEGWGGLGGPDWDSTLSYGANSTVMYPPGSGIFYHVPDGGSSVSVNTVPANSAGVANQGWVGPCTCEEIWFQGQANPTWTGSGPVYSQFVWDSSVSYPQSLLVMHLGTIWVSQISNNLGNVPAANSASWLKCEGDCATAGGVVGAPYMAGQIYDFGDVAEFPSNSGLFYTYISAGSSLAAPPVTANGPNLKWSGPCNCDEIWVQSGMEIWDSQATYNEWQLVKAGSILFYSTTNSNTGIQPGTSSDWERCGFTCDGLRGIAGPLWTASANVQPNFVYEYPANSGLFYMALTYAGTNAPAPDSDPTVWEGPCRCGNIGDNSVSWSSTGTYDKYEVIWSNSGSSPYWYISLIPNNVGNDPPTSPNEWRRCGWNCDDGATGFSFGGMAGPAFVSGSTAVTAGEVYEFPAYSGTFYLVWGPYTQLANAPDPGTNPDVWSPPCDCEMIWSAPDNVPSPMYDPAVAYGQWEIVGTAAATPGTTDLWVSEMNNNLGNTPSALSPAWDICGEHCDRFDGYGGPVWVSSQTVNSGDIYEHPANSGAFYMVITQNAVSNSPVPGTDPDIWSDPCDCESIWQDGVDPPTPPPVYSTTTVYSQWEIVEHNGYFWLAMNNGMLSVPSPLNPQWKMCGDDVSPCVYGATLDNAWPMWTNPQWPVWTSGYSMGDQVSHGNAFYISVVNSNMLEPSDATVAMGRWIECDCADLLVDATLSYDPSVIYEQGDAIYHQGALWFATDDGTLATPGSGTTDWRPCNWCDMTDSNIQAWSTSIAGAANYQIGDTVAHNGVYYVSILDDNRKEPGVNVIWITPWWSLQNFYMEGWVECDCAEIAQDYLPGFTYSQGDVVNGPDGQTWISLYSGNNVWPGLVIGGPPWGPWVISTWELCNPGTCQNPTVWTAPPGVVSGYQDGDAVTHVGTTWFLQPGNAGTAVPPDWSMAASPGPWQLCTAIANPPWVMSPTIGGAVGELKSTETVEQWFSVSSDTIATLNWDFLDDANKDVAYSQGTFMMTGEPSLSKVINSENTTFNTVYRTNVSLAEMDSTNLDILVSTGIWIVAPCDSNYGITSNLGGEVLCGMWWHDGSTVPIGDGDDLANLLRVRPGMLCPTDADGCVDLVIEDITGQFEWDRDTDADGVIDLWDDCMETPQGVATDANGCEVKVVEEKDEGGGLPGFSFMMTMSALLGAIMYLGRVRREN